MTDDMEITHIAYKCLVKIMLWVYGKARNKTTEDDQVIEVFFGSSASQFKGFCDLRTNLIIALRTGQAPQPNQFALKAISLFTKHIRRFGKLFRRMQQHNLPKFITLPFCTDVVLYYLNKVVEAVNGPKEYIDDDPNAVYPQKFILQAMVIFKESLSQWSPNRRLCSSMDSDEVLPQPFVENAVNLLLTRFIPLSQEDLEGWMASPEEWVNNDEKEVDAWEFELRPCTERVLLTLAMQYSKYVVDLLKKTLMQAIETPATTLDSILAREAIYCAVGRCAHRMKDNIDFNAWLSNVLVPEAQSQDPNYRIIKRRIGWVIGRWFYDHCAPATNPDVWRILVHLLMDRSDGSDTVVRMSAANSLRECVDTVDFDADVFAPFIEGSFTGLAALLAEAETFESKNRVMKSLSCVIGRIDRRVVPYIPLIGELIVKYWNINPQETEVLFLATLLVTTTELVEASKEASATLQPLVVKLVQDSLDDKTQPKLKLELDEDALNLWRTALRNTHTIQPVQPGQEGLFQLAPIAIALLASNLDLLGSVLSIIESYIILGGQEFFQQYSFDLHHAFSRCLSQANPINVKDLLRSIQLMLQIVPTEYWEEPMHQSKLFWEMLRTVNDGKGNELVLIEYIYVFARLVLQDAPAFARLMSYTASSYDIVEIQLYDKLMQQWWQKFDNMAEPRHRKLVAMSYAALLPIGHPEIIKRLGGEIFNVWLDVLGEMKEAVESDDEGQAQHLHLYWKQPGSEPPSIVLRDTEGTLEEAKRRQLYESDPVQATKLTTYLAAKLREAKRAHPILQEYIKASDQMVWEAVKKALEIPQDDLDFPRTSSY
jgi:hypothetical protein